MTVIAIKTERFGLDLKWNDPPCGIASLKSYEFGTAFERNAFLLLLGVEAAMEAAREGYHDFEATKIPAAEP